MSFFQSEIVQEEINRIQELQEQIYAKLFFFSSMTKEDKLEHIEMLEELLKKQEVLYARMSLSDDPEAKLMKKSLMESAQQMGFSRDVDLKYVFSNMTNIIDNMRKSLDTFS
jgi:GTPase Era involved in 16S rRNA processing